MRIVIARAQKARIGTDNKIVVAPAADAHARAIVGAQVARVGSRDNHRPRPIGMRAPFERHF